MSNRIDKYSEIDYLFKRKSNKLSEKDFNKMCELAFKEDEEDKKERKQMSNKVDKYSEIDYSKDKFASEDFLDSLLFWIVLVILTIAYILWKS